MTDPRTTLPASARPLQCGARACFYDNRRCTLTARHDGWHHNADQTSTVRWNNDGSYELETLTHATTPGAPA